MTEFQIDLCIVIIVMLCMMGGSRGLCSSDVYIRQLVEKNEDFHNRRCIWEGGVSVVVMCTPDNR